MNWKKRNISSGKNKELGNGGKMVKRIVYNVQTEKLGGEWTEFWKRKNISWKMHHDFLICVPSHPAALEYPDIQPFA